jgi:uncharacterized protein YbcV (DUF1398 family)
LQISIKNNEIKKITDSDQKIFLEQLRYIEKFQQDSRGLKQALIQYVSADGVIDDRSILEKIEMLGDKDRALISEILEFLERFEISYEKFRKYIAKHYEIGILAGTIHASKFLTDRKLQFYIDVMAQISVQFSIWNHKVMILKDYQFLETSRDILDGAETLQDYVKTLISDS